MTLDEFVAVFAGTEGWNWRIENDPVADGWLVGDMPAKVPGPPASDASGQWCCPITAVAHKLRGVTLPVDQYDKAAKRIGLPGKLASQIVIASDKGVGHDEELRARLLAAVGVKESRSHR
jgi:hypothetical protein